MIFSSSKARALSAIVSGGSFAAAAQELEISQAAIRQQVRQLEALCGAPLVERRDGQMAFTPLCLELADIAERVLLLEQGAEQALRRNQMLAGAELRIAMGQSRSTLEVLGAFRRHFPKVRVNVEFATHEAILRSVLDRSADVGMLACAPEDRRFRRAELIGHRIEMVCVMPETSPLAARAQLSLHDLMGQELLFQARGSLTQKLVDEAFAACGLAPVPRVTISTASGICEAVSHGLGIGFVWKDCVPEGADLHQGRVKELSQSYREAAFSLADTQNRACNAFFAMVEGMNSGASQPTPRH